MEYPVGSQVMLVKDYKSKSDERYEGPFTVNGITKNKAYILRDVTGRLYPRDIPINQLKLISGDLTTDENGEERYEVQAVVAHKLDPRVKGKYLYLVNWKNYSEEDNTWEPVKNFDDRACIEEYWKHLNIAKELQGFSRLTRLPYTINGGKNEHQCNK
ncbi:hypothetical protein DFQ28_003998 [Apophysomyces sp. BC1034]|nr:hypothetical protein DFQ28_003998 [Apophysomyces sp. BC1034]